jgi:hypothetical protein
LPGYNTGYKRGRRIEPHILRQKVGPEMDISGHFVFSAYSKGYFKVEE